MQDFEAMPRAWVIVAGGFRIDERISEHAKGR